MNTNLEEFAVVEGTPFKGSAVLASEDYLQVEHVHMEVRVWEKYSEDQWVRENDRDVRKMVEKKDQLFSECDRISAICGNEVEQGGLPI